MLPRKGGLKQQLPALRGGEAARSHLKRERRGATCITEIKAILGALPGNWSAPQSPIAASVMISSCALSWQAGSHQQHWRHRVPAFYHRPRPVLAGQAALSGHVSVEAPDQAAALLPYGVAVKQGPRETMEDYVSVQPAHYGFLFTGEGPTCNCGLSGLGWGRLLRFGGAQPQTEPAHISGTLAGCGWASKGLRPT